MEQVVGRHAGQSQGDWLHARRYRSIPQVRGDTLMTPDYTAFQMRSCGQYVRLSLTGSQ